MFIKLWGQVKFTGQCLLALKPLYRHIKDRRTFLLHRKHSSVKKINRMCKRGDNTIKSPVNIFSLPCWKKPWGKKKLEQRKKIYLVQNIHPVKKIKASLKLSSKGVIYSSLSLLDLSLVIYIFRCWIPVETVLITIW